MMSASTTLLTGLLGLPTSSVLLVWQKSCKLKAESQSRHCDERLCQTIET